MTEEVMMSSKVGRLFGVLAVVLIGGTAGTTSAATNRHKVVFGITGPKQVTAGHVVKFKITASSEGGYQNWLVAVSNFVDGKQVEVDNNLKIIGSSENYKIDKIVRYWYWLPYPHQENKEISKTWTIRVIIPDLGDEHSLYCLGLMTRAATPSSRTATTFWEEYVPPNQSYCVGYTR